MATLTKSTGTVTLSGAVEKVSLPAVYGWVWVKNMSDGDMFLGLDDGISAGADGVMRIPAGECGRVQTDGFNSVYLMGTGNALVVAQNYADCPFKVGGKGGEIPDLSAYAKKSDIPPEINVMTYTVIFSNITWDISNSGNGKYYYLPNALNVNKILSVSIGMWEGLVTDDWIIPYIRSDNQFAIFSNVGKTSGKMAFRIAYI